MTTNVEIEAAARRLWDMEQAAAWDDGDPRQADRRQAYRHAARQALEAAEKARRAAEKADA